MLLYAIQLLILLYLSAFSIGQLERDLCALESDPGFGDTNEVAYSYDQYQGVCIEMAYSGEGGNANRFSTLAECRAACGLGSQDSVNRCELPVAEGRCEVERSRYYFDGNSCQKFTYRGCRGNANNFETEEECNLECASQRDEKDPAFVCMQDVAPGNCLAAFNNWYFDKNQRQCLSFVYGGCGGNSNRFETKSDCERTCSEFLGPLDPAEVCKLPKVVGRCRASIPAFYFNAEVGSCQEFTYGGCDGNQNNFATMEECTEFCSSSVRAVQTLTKEEICLQPYDPGECFASLQRFYFEAATGECQEFGYGGCSGNQNRFETYDECLQTCAVLREPRNGQCPQVDVIERCETFNHQCTWDYECNKGMKCCNTGCGTECLHAAVYDMVDEDICQLPKQVGPCKAYENRYYYNTELDECVLFVYGGCQGNENSFRTLAECKTRCKGEPYEEEKLSSSWCEEPRSVGACNEQVERFFYNSESGLCESFEYSGCLGSRNNFASMAECQQVCIDSRRDEVLLEAEAICRLPAELGSCSDLAPFWFFNVDAQRCEIFQYSGCGGNDNRFASEDECKKTCVKRDPSVCLLELDIGDCFDEIDRWYFNKETGSCDRFSFTGCRGNLNNFANAGVCEETCEMYLRAKPTTRLTTVSSNRCSARLSYERTCQMSTGYRFDVSLGRCVEETTEFCQQENFYPTMRLCETTCGSKTVEDPCQLQFDTGPCKAFVPRYYYDASLGTCQDFVYGGCEGNMNNFETVENCMRACGSASTPEQYDCSSLPDPGNCFGYFERYSYDSTSGQCMKFIYGGCGGNANNYETPQACMQACSSSKQPEVKSADCGSEFGCCPDNRTAATDESLQNCPPMKVVIEKGNSEVSSPVGASVVLPCVAVGAPRPELYWYYNNNPIDFYQRTDYELMSNNWLRIPAVQGRHFGQYLCYAVNGEEQNYDMHFISLSEGSATSNGIVGPDYSPVPDGDSQVDRDTGAPIVSPELTQQTPAPAVPTPSPVEKPEDAFYESGQTEYAINIGETAELICPLFNYIDPIVTVRWYKNGDVLPGSYRLISFRDGQYSRQSLLIESTALIHNGQYLCDVTTQQGLQRNATVVLQLKEPLTGEVRQVTSPVKEGSSVTLHCRANGLPMPTIEWLNASRLKPNKKRFVQAQFGAVSELKIAAVTATDAGRYICLAKNAFESWEDSVELEVQPRSTADTDEKGEGAQMVCRDSNNVNCRLVVAIGFCVRPQYSKSCCQSCEEVGQFPPVTA